MNHEDLVAVEHSKIADLGVASLETEGTGGDYEEMGSGPQPTQPNPGAR